MNVKTLKAVLESLPTLPVFMFQSGTWELLAGQGRARTVAKRLPASGEVWFHLVPDYDYPSPVVEIVVTSGEIVKRKGLVIFLGCDTAIVPAEVARRRYEP